MTRKRPCLNDSTSELVAVPGRSSAAVFEPRLVWRTTKWKADVDGLEKRGRSSSRRPRRHYERLRSALLTGGRPLGKARRAIVRSPAAPSVPGGMDGPNLSTRTRHGA